MCASVEVEIKEENLDEFTTPGVERNDLVFVDCASVKTEIKEEVLEPEDQTTTVYYEKGTV